MPRRSASSAWAGGVAALDYLLQSMAGGIRDAPGHRPRHLLRVSFLPSPAASPSVLVSLLVGRKNRKIDMVEALKGTE